MYGPLGRTSQGIQRYTRLFSKIRVKQSSLLGPQNGRGALNQAHTIFYLKNDPVKQSSLLGPQGGSFLEPLEPSSKQYQYYYVFFDKINRFYVRGIGWVKENILDKTHFTFATLFKGRFLMT